MTQHGEDHRNDDSSFDPDRGIYSIVSTGTETIFHDKHETGRAEIVRTEILAEGIDEALQGLEGVITTEGLNVLQVIRLRFGFESQRSLQPSEIAKQLGTTSGNVAKALTIGLRELRNRKQDLKWLMALIGRRLNEV